MNGSDIQHKSLGLLSVVLSGALLVLSTCHDKQPCCVRPPILPLASVTLLTVMNKAKAQLFLHHSSSISLRHIYPEMPLKTGMWFSDYRVSTAAAASLQVCYVRESIQSRSSRVRRNSRNHRSSPEELPCTTGSLSARFCLARKLSLETIVKHPGTGISFSRGIWARDAVSTALNFQIVLLLVHSA